MPEPFRNYAKEYAKMFNLPPQAVNESNAEFRARVARQLDDQGQHVYASEALFNKRMSGDPSAHFSLDRGYGESFIDHVAQVTEAELREGQKPKPRRGRRFIVYFLVLETAWLGLSLWIGLGSVYVIGAIVAFILASLIALS